MRAKVKAFGQQNYRDGALQRIGEATLLMRGGMFAGAIYLSGRAVEGMFRALIWKNDPQVQRGNKSLDTGHDLRELLTSIRRLGVIGSDATAENQEFEAQVLFVARLWYNNMRFASSRHVETRWHMLGEVRKGRTFKQAAMEYFDACVMIVRRCEVLCGK